jgi:hypothetical protein
LIVSQFRKLIDFFDLVALKWIVDLLRFRAIPFLFFVSRRISISLVIGGQFGLSHPNGGELASASSDRSPSNRRFAFWPQTRRFLFWGGSTITLTPLECEGKKEEEEEEGDDEEKEEGEKSAL